jgi:hypothetical protein
MSVDVKDLGTLDAGKVAQFDASLTALIQEYNPTIDVKSGTFHDLVLHLKAILDAADQTNIDLVVQSSSLQAVKANPLLADPTILTTLLSNYNITASAGTKASGNVTVVLSALVGTTITAGSTFTINNISFVSPVTYVGRTSSALVVGTNDVLISQVTSTTYAFTIKLNAVNVGLAGNATQNSVVTPTTPPAYFTNAYVTTDFTGGTDADTNQTLLNKLESGLGIGAWSNRVTVGSLITKQTAFANVVNMSIIGFGDPEMLRDQHAIWPGSLGGRCDLYLRSQPLYATKLLSKTATLISKNGAVGTWQFGIGRDDAPGFYKVSKILLPALDQTGSGFQPTVDARSLDLTGVSGVPDLVSTLVNEGIYSRYQASTINFIDTLTDATGLTINSSTNVYNVYVLAMPLIADLQTFLLTRDVAPPMCDVLVKAPIPCFISLSLTVNYKTGTTPPVTSAIQAALATAVNGLEFPGSLAASFINQTLHDLLTNLVSITGLTMTGVIRKPDGTSTTITDSSLLTIPNDYPNMTSGRTVALLLNPTDITISLVATAVPSV